MEIVYNIKIRGKLGPGPDDDKSIGIINGRVDTCPGDMCRRCCVRNILLLVYSLMLARIIDQ